MEQLVISGDVRKNLVSGLVTAKVILQRAVPKYRHLSTGGLQKALDSVESALAIVEPTSQDYFEELEKAVASLTPGPAKVSAERSLKALKAQRQSEQMDALDSLLEQALTSLVGPGRLHRIDLGNLPRSRRSY